ncbi:MAG TPA: serine hydrolase domain-containing protein, partial [Phenylobacterium sp.]|nr:serine hydrolase domain-containing protein [Phenylobacterium sp.]
LSPARKVDPDTTLFRIGSISKTFTWIALMREVEAGRIRIDGPVNLYLPETLQVRDQGFRAPVRVINLMDHSAGFEDRALGQLIERDLRRERPMVEYLRQERPQRVHAPGAMASYSNYGAALAGEAVAYVTGKPYEQLIEEEIFAPLGLRHTTFREVRAAGKDLAAPMPAYMARDVSQGFRWTDAGFKARPYELLGHIAPAGAASSTAADMARYMAALLNDGALDGATLFGPRAAKAFRTPPPWVDYLMADDYGDQFPAFPREHGAPGGLPMVNFPEISMYQMGPWGGYGANPLPAHLQRIWDSSRHLLSGGFPYSEGIFEDINKALCAQFCWHDAADARAIVREYAAGEFSPAVADDVVRSVAILEANHARGWY